MIRVLPQTVINQIAAGEVVVRMASAVKELVENAIDAGAASIEVTLDEQVRNLVVRDDGSGMGRDDAEMSLQRHATSKIRSIEDLIALRTRGFRGEALASIAAVSRLELTTRRREDLEGTRILVEGGTIERIEGVGCPAGTRIAVRDLFFNTPARLRFLKSPAAELNAVSHTLTRQALSAHAVGIRLLRSGEELLSLPPGQDEAARYASILGSALTAPLVSMAHDRPGVRVRGHLAPPECTRGDRRFQFFFVEGRPFSSKTLTAALEQALRGFTMVGRHPMALVMIEVDPGDVDFNVHPTKEEVRFRDESAVAGAVYRAAEEAIARGAQRGLVPRITPDSDGGPTPAALSVTHRTAEVIPAPAFLTDPTALIRRAFEAKSPRGVQRDLLVDAEQRARLLGPAPATEIAAADAGHPGRVVVRHADGSEISAGPGERPDEELWAVPADPEPLGQIARTYIVARFGDDLLLVDQHAAHERLVYLQLARRGVSVETQGLLVPVMLELPAPLEAVMVSQREALNTLGFDCERFGPRAWAVSSQPADLGESDVAALVLDILSDLAEAPREEALSLRRDRILIRQACHSAIRAGQDLPLSQMRELLSQMRAERLSFTCPHGRPTIVRLARRELERLFKRVV